MSQTETITVSPATPEPVLLEHFDAGVLTLTMNRPDRLNALTIPLMRTLGESLSGAAVNPDVRVVVIAGAGRGFCAGGDVKEGRKDDRAGDRPKTDPGYFKSEQRYDRLRRNVEPPILIHNMPKPVIASVRGPATGAGFGVAAAADFRVVSKTAVFATAFARGGFSGDYGGSYFLTKLLGSAKARELYMLNPKITAEQANALGLVTKLVEDAALEAETNALARQLAEGPSVAFRYMKRAINLAETSRLEDVSDFEVASMVRLSETEDQKEAIRAIVEKRDPVFKGY